MDECWNCGHDLEFHTSDFVLNDNWKDKCNHVGEQEKCTCEEFSPTVKQLMSIILGRKKPMKISL